jgi:DNA invertase Pin-like site-specific DNA recombinase
MVWRLDRLGRTMHHLIQVVNDLNNRGLVFIVFKKILRWIAPMRQDN